MTKKEKQIDSIDREILSVMFHSRRPMTGNDLAKRINLSSPAIRPRLDYLKMKGIIKIVRKTGERRFNRVFGNKIRAINSPRSIFWGIDIKQGK